MLKSFATEMSTETEMGTPSFEIRQIADADEARCLDFAVDALQVDPEAFARWREASPDAYLAAWFGDELVGVCLGHEEGERILRVTLDGIFVAPERRGAGVGRALLVEFEAAVFGRSDYLLHGAAAEAAEAFLARIGYERQEARDGPSWFRVNPVHRLPEAEVLGFLKRIETGEVTLAFKPGHSPSTLCAYDASNGWTISVFYDVDEWDYVDSIQSDDGRDYYYDLYRTVAEYYPTDEVVRERYHGPVPTQYRTWDCQRCSARSVVERSVDPALASTRAPSLRLATLRVLPWRYRDLCVRCRQEAGPIDWLRRRSASGS